MVLLEKFNARSFQLLERRLEEQQVTNLVCEDLNLIKK